jgi:tetratricopeptide (TPR) repeat protein
MTWYPMTISNSQRKKEQPDMALRGICSVQWVVLGVVAVTLSACSSSQVTSASQTTPALPPAVLLPSEDAVAWQTIRFLEKRILQDPDDFIAHNKLAALYLQRVRESGDVTYLKLASHAAHASLGTLPAERNTGGLTALAQVEFTSHDFVGARDHARRLTELESDKSYPYLILGDTLLELGEYDKATGAFWQMEQLGGIQGLTRVAIQQRRARLAVLRGDTDMAQRTLSTALQLALAMPVPPRETVAWCRWQLGETAFSVGDYASAEQHYRDALVTFPDYFRALSSLGRVRAARGDLPSAIEQYERVVRILPDPTFVAALGDLYKMVGRDKEAAAQYELVEQIARLTTAGGTLYNRQLALFYADHDIKPEEAYRYATKEYAMRRDIYGADAVAWTALKAGKIGEAQAAINEALRLKTRDARLFYHAGMIARAAGDEVSARDYFERALKLNPQFDPLQARVAKIMANRHLLN